MRKVKCKICGESWKAYKKETVLSFMERHIELHQLNAPQQDVLELINWQKQWFPEEGREEKPDENMQERRQNEDTRL